MLLEIEQTRIEPDVTVLKFTGKLTLGRESQRVETLVLDLIRKGEKKFVFDLGGVTYIDSSGLGIITLCSGSAVQAGGGLRVAGASGIAERLFKVTKLDSVIPFYATVEEASAAFRGGS